MNDQEVVKKLYEWGEKINLAMIEMEMIFLEHMGVTKFHYDEVEEWKTALPPHILLSAERVLNYCKMKYKLAKLKIRWIERTFDEPGDFAFDLPIMGQARSENDLLINPHVEYAQVARTVAHEAFHAFRLKQGIAEDEEGTAEQAVEDILRETEELRQD